MHEGKAFYLDSLDLCFKNSGNGLKAEKLQKLKVKCEKVNFEDLGHQLRKLGQTSVLRFYPHVMTYNL